MDKITQTQVPSNAQHRPKAIANASGASQGASPTSFKMADGTCVMRLDNINSFLDNVQKLDEKTE